MYAALFSRFRTVSNAIIEAGLPSLVAAVILSAHPALAQPAYSITTFNYQDAPYTTAQGINNTGSVVGYSFLSGSTSWYQYPIAGWVATNGGFTTVQDPDWLNTSLYGVNDSGQIVGFVSDGSGLASGMLYNGGTFNIFSAPDAPWTIPTGINNSGEVVGTYTMSNGITNGFVYLNGLITTIDYPGAPYTIGVALNNAGDVVGAYGDGSGYWNGFLYHDGDYSTLAFGYPIAINDSGEILGFPGCCGSQEFSIYENGTYQPLGLEIPGATYMMPEGLNDAGQIVGVYQNTSGQMYGFEADPIPEPVSLALLGTSLVGLAAVRRRRG